MRQLCLAFLLLSLAACSLQADQAAVQPTASPTPSLPNTPLATPLPMVNPTAAPTLQPTPGQLVVNPACTPRADWQTYRVVPGDTLSGIAVRTGSTVEALAQANCLTDKNIISVGQPLRVPVMPVPPTTTAPQPNVGKVTVSPASTDGDWFVVTPGTTVTFSWTGAAASATSVEFYLQRLDIPVSPQLIGTDTNLADGASITWTVISIQAMVTAVAKQGATLVNQTPTATQIKTAAANAPLGKVQVTPNLGTQDGWLKLTAGSTVTVSWQEAANLGDVEIHFYFAPTGTGMTPQEIGADYNVYDGVSIQWVVMSGGAGYLSARAASKGGHALVANTDGELGVMAQ